MKTIALTIIILMLLGVVPAPTIPPSSNIPYDPNAITDVMGTYVVQEGQILASECITVYSDDVNTPTATATKIQLEEPFKNTEGEWQYNWTYLATERGLVYDQITVTDSYGTDERDIVFRVTGRPIITGCRPR